MVEIALAAAAALGKEARTARHRLPRTAAGWPSAPGAPRFRNDAQFYRDRGVISYKRGALQQAISDLDEEGPLSNR